MVRLRLSHCFVRCRICNDILVHDWSYLMQGLGFHSITPASYNLLTIFPANDLSFQDPIQVIVIFKCLNICRPLRRCLSQYDYIITKSVTVCIGLGSILMVLIAPFLAENFKTYGLVGLMFGTTRSPCLPSLCVPRPLALQLDWLYALTDALFLNLLLVTLVLGRLVKLRILSCCLLKHIGGSLTRWHLPQRVSINAQIFCFIQKVGRWNLSLSTGGVLQSCWARIDCNIFWILFFMHRMPLQQFIGCMLKHSFVTWPSSWDKTFNNIFIGI